MGLEHFYFKMRQCCTVIATNFEMPCAESQTQGETRYNSLNAGAHVKRWPLRAGGSAWIWRFLFICILAYPEFRQFIPLDKIKMFPFPTLWHNNYAAVRIISC